MAFTHRNKEATDFIDITDGYAVVNVYFDNKDIWSTSVTAWQSYFEDIGIFAQLPLKDAPSSVTPVSILKSYQPDYGQMENLGIRNN